MSYYICYATEDRTNARRLTLELRALGREVVFIDRGDSELLTDPMEDIMHGIAASDTLVVVHSEHTNATMLSQIEITYAKNIRRKIIVIKTGRAALSDSIRFELGNVPIITESNMASAAKKILNTEGRSV